MTTPTDPEDTPTPVTVERQKKPKSITEALDAASLAVARAAKAEATAADAVKAATSGRDDRWEVIGAFLLSRNFIVGCVSLLIAFALVLAAATGELSEIVALIVPASWSAATGGVP